MSIKPPATKVRVKKEVYTETFKRVCYELSCGEFIGEAFYDPDIFMGEDGWRWFVWHSSSSEEGTPNVFDFLKAAGVCETSEEAVEKAKKSLIDMERQRERVSRWVLWRPEGELFYGAYAETDRYIFALRWEGYSDDGAYVLSRFPLGADLNKDKPLHVYKKRVKGFVAAMKSAKL